MLCSYYYDIETGWYYLQSRYYDPVIHRFINADSYASTGQGFLGYNMFAYCNNNPILASDKSGTLSDDVSIGIIDWLLSTLGESIEAVGPYALAVAGVVLLGKVVKEILNDVPVVSIPSSASDCLNPPAEPVEKAREKINAVSVAADRRERRCSYWEAERVGNIVLIGRGLTLYEASLYVASGKNILCKNEMAARSVLLVNGYVHPVGPEKHGGENYYYHYHPNRHSHTHIWFYRAPILNNKEERK